MYKEDKLSKYPTYIKSHEFVDLVFVYACCLRFNSINTITDKSLAGLRKLELLMVHGNDIHNLPDGVFRDLVSLQVSC